MTHLLDTNAWVEYIRGKNQTLAARIKQHFPNDLGFSTMVLAELTFGAHRSGASRVAPNLAAIR